jgi:hypothetical protein
MANITIETVSNFPFDLNAGIRILPNADRRIGPCMLYGGLHDCTLYLYGIIDRRAYNIEPVDVDWYLECRRPYTIV